MSVDIVAVEERVWSGSASLVTAQTTEGEIGVMPGHEPLLGQLVEGGIVTVKAADGERLVMAVHGGFLSVTGTTVTVLAEAADRVEDIDVEAAKSALADNDRDASELAAARGRLRAVERA